MVLWRDFPRVYMLLFVGGAFFFGLFAGSFLNVIICRLHTGEQFLRGRSHCPHCGHVLSWYELIPALSFLIQGAKCRICHKPISWQYPLVELATGVLFAFTAQHIASTVNPIINFYPHLLSSIFYLLILSGLIVIFAYDLKHYIIPDSALLFLIIVTLTASVFGIWGLEFIWKLEIGNWKLDTLVTGIFSGLLTASPFFTIVLISKGMWMGLGDVKFAFFMGLLLGLYAFLAMFLAVVLGAIIGVTLIALGKKTMQSEIPFGPFLVIGTALTLFYGKNIWSWYLAFLGI